MVAIDSRISTFVTNLEHHPRADSLIPLVEQLLEVEDPLIEAQLTTSLQNVCQENVELIVDFWILRGILYLEEKHNLRALQTFWKGLQFHNRSHSAWKRIIDILNKRRNWIQTSFFLIEALKIFSNDREFQDLFHHGSANLLENIQISPGIHDETRSLTEFRQSENIIQRESTSVIIDKPKRLKLSSSVQNLWDQAQECFQEFTSAHEKIFTQAFVHYAHSTLRELFNLDGNFRVGIDDVIDRFQLSDYKQFLYQNYEYLQSLL